MVRKTFNKSLLDMICTRDKCQVNLTQEEYNNLGIYTKISFVCGKENCNKNGEKRFCNMYDSGGFCVECMRKQKQEKLKRGNFIQYIKDTNIPKIRFNKSLLDMVCTRDKCQVNLTQEEYSKLNMTTRISFVCGKENCNKNGEKCFREIHDNGGFCMDCMKKQKLEKLASTLTNIVRYIGDTNIPKIRFNKTLLDEICRRDKCKVESLTQQQYKKLNRNTRITFICGSENCNEKGDKVLREMHRGGAFCSACMTKISQEKYRNTSIIKYGTDSPSKTVEVLQKMKDTNNIRYGEDHVLQNAEMSAKANKNAYKSKPFTFPCGNVVQVQGYEPFALELLVQQGKKFEDITTNRREVPDIRYKTEDNKKHRYFCDILLHNEDKIVEVKSTWTYQRHEETIIPLKAQACIDAGFEYEIWIFDEKKNLQVKTYDKPVVTFSEMLLSM